MALCIECGNALSQGSRSMDGNDHLSAISTGAGVVGGRRVEATVFRCSVCNAMWQRETDASSLKEIWYLKAGI